MKRFIVLISVFSCTLLPAQSDSLNERMQNYLLSNGTIEYYSNVIDRMFDFLKTEFEGKDVSEAVWKEMAEVKSEGLQDITEMIIQAYEGHFSREELMAMLDFYKSETGQNILLKNDLSPDEVEKRDEFYASSVGQKISVSSESLNNLLQKMTQEWSADLYNNVIQQLKAKGITKGD